MYPDPKRIRRNKMTVRLDDYEQALVVSLANYTGEQPSTLLRQLIMQEALRIFEADKQIMQLEAA